MRPKVGQYFYTYHGIGIRIYKYTKVHQHGTAISEPVPDEAVYFNREDARKRVYELNGWKYKEKQQCLTTAKKPAIPAALKKGI